MVSLQINKHTYFCPSDWAELKWSQFIALNRFVHCPENTRTTENNDQRNPNDVEENKQYFIRTNAEKEIELLILFCGVEQHIAMCVDPMDRKQFVTSLIRHFIDPLQMAFNRHETMDRSIDESIPDSMALQKHEFRCGNETLCLPLSEQTFDGEWVPLCEVSAIQWCEAADLYLADKWEYAPLIAAVLCKGEESQYIERVVKRRAELMRDMPMSIITALFLALNDAHRKMKELYSACYSKKSGTVDSAQKVSSFSWNELLLWAGHFRADEIEQVRSMNCYDFMALVNGRIKAGD